MGPDDAGGSSQLTMAAGVAAQVEDRFDNLSQDFYNLSEMISTDAWPDYDLSRHGPLHQ